MLQIKRSLNSMNIKQNTINNLWHVLSFFMYMFESHKIPLAFVCLRPVSEKDLQEGLNWNN